MALLVLLWAQAMTDPSSLVPTTLVQHDLNAALASATPGIAVENRVGFGFATLCIDDDVIPGSRERVLAVARAMSLHPELQIQIEGHVGTSSPFEVAQENSEARAHIVAAVLEQLGVEPSRMATRGWANRVSDAALGFQEPVAAVAKAGFGWADMYFTTDSAAVGKYATSEREFPVRPHYYDEFLTTASVQVSPPPPSSRAAPRSHPIFYMQPGARVGETVSLHFSEPRYRLLIRRAWSSDRLFVYCRDAPFSGPEPRTNGCVNVRVEDVVFHDDGTADARGVAVEAITLSEVTLEPGTGGLFSTPLHTPPPRPAALPPAPAAVPPAAAAMGLLDLSREDEEDADEEDDNEATAAAAHAAAATVDAAAPLGRFHGAFASSPRTSKHGSARIEHLKLQATLAANAMLLLLAFVAIFLGCRLTTWERKPTPTMRFCPAPHKTRLPGTRRKLGGKVRPVQVAEPLVLPTAPGLAEASVKAKLATVRV